MDQEKPQEKDVQTKPTRREREAQALRDNLAKRKAQTHQRESEKESE